MAVPLNLSATFISTIERIVKQKDNQHLDNEIRLINESILAGRQYMHLEHDIVMTSSAIKINSVFVCNQTSATIDLAGNNYLIVNDKDINLGSKSNYFEGKAVRNLGTLKLVDAWSSRFEVAMFAQPYIHDGDTTIYGLLLLAGTRIDAIARDNLIEIDPENQVCSIGWRPKSCRKKIKEIEDEAKKGIQNQVYSQGLYGSQGIVKTINAPYCIYQSDPEKTLEPEPSVQRTLSPNEELLVSKTFNAARLFIKLEFNIDIGVAPTRVNNVLVYNLTGTSIVLEGNNFVIVDDRFLNFKNSSYKGILKLLDCKSSLLELAFFIQPFVNNGNFTIYGLFLSAGTRFDTIFHENCVEIDPLTSEFNLEWLPKTCRNKEFMDRYNSKAITEEDILNLAGETKSRDIDHMLGSGVSGGTETMSFVGWSSPAVKSFITKGAALTPSVNSW